jgi:hypothetical protein
MTLEKCYNGEWRLRRGIVMTLEKCYNWIEEWRWLENEIVMILEKGSNRRIKMTRKRECYGTRKCYNLRTEIVMRLEKCYNLRMKIVMTTRKWDCYGTRKML